MSVMDRYNEWRGKDRRRHEVIHVAVTHDLSDNTAELIERLIESLSNNHQFPDLEFMKQRLELIHDSTFQLNRKVDEFMSTQENRLQGIQSALTSIADGINTLQQQVADLKANNPALEDEISGIEGTVKSIADDINGVVPDAGGGSAGGGEGGGTEPAPEGGGTR